MSLFDELTYKVNKYFTEKYVVEKTTIVPSTDYSKLTFSNKGLIAELTFLFIDIRESSQLHDKYGHTVAAQIYQSFHEINVRIIKSCDGQVRAFDGDRIMGVFSGSDKNNNAVKAALKIRWAISKVLNTELIPKKPINIGLGIDTGETLITKVGTSRDSNNNDLVWVGKACNYASHLSNESKNEIYISTSIYNKLNKTNKFSNEIDMWKKVEIKLKSGKNIVCYKTNYYTVIK